MARLREKGAHQVKRKINLVCVRYVPPLSFCGIRALRTERDLNRPKSIIRTKNQGIHLINASFVETLTTRPSFFFFFFFKISDRCVRCAGDHPSRTFSKDSAPGNKKKEGINQVPSAALTVEETNCFLNERISLPRRQWVGLPVADGWRYERLERNDKSLHLKADRSYITKFKTLTENVRQQPGSR